MVPPVLVMHISYSSYCWQSRSRFINASFAENGQGLGVEEHGLGQRCRLGLPMRGILLCYQNDRHDHRRYNTEPPISVLRVRRTFGTFTGLARIRYLSIKASDKKLQKGFKKRERVSGIAFASMYIVYTGRG